FDINDFDETFPGPFEWDVKRLAASFVVGGRQLGFKRKEGHDAALAAARTYREGIRKLAGERSIDVWYERIDIDVIERYRDMVNKKQAKNFDKGVAKAESKNSLRAFAKLTRQDGDRLRMVSDPPLIVPIEDIVRQEGGDVEELQNRMNVFVDEYRGTLQPDIRSLADRYHYVDPGPQRGGVGGVGTRCWIVLLLGRDSQDPLFLQVKEAAPSVLSPFTSGARYKNQGRRVVEGQRLTQAASDILLGWLTAAGVDGERRDFYVRQLWDGKGSAEIEAVTPYTMGLYAQLCGATLARAHARSGDRIAIASYMGGSDKFDSAIADFSEAYADQNERDSEAFAAAVKSGKLEARTDL